VTDSARCSTSCVAQACRWNTDNRVQCLTSLCGAGVPALEQPAGVGCAGEHLHDVPLARAIHVLQVPQDLLLPQGKNVHES
jgi:hypothetical protein